MKRTGFGAKALDAFDAWFASSGGVWQTFAVTILIVILERIFPHADPNGFWLLYVFTVYSGVTQPALAHVGAVSAQRQEIVLAEVRAIAAKIDAEEGEELEILRRIEEFLREGRGECLTEDPGGVPAEFRDGPGWSEGIRRDDIYRKEQLNPWAGVGVMALHSHTAGEPCDQDCTVYGESDDDHE